MTSRRPSGTELLRVARPRECNTQQTPKSPKNDATSPATTAQHGGLKALALLALARNKPCNNSAQTLSGTAQQRPSESPPAVARDVVPLRVACVAFPGEATTQHAAELVRRAVVRFSMGGDPPSAWAVCLGRPGELVASVVAGLRERYGDRLAEVGHD